MSLIALHDLTKRYPRGVTALDGLTLDLEPGIIGLVGANGAGKSTLIKILLGLLPPTSGDASVMDLDVRTKGMTIRQFVGYMPEYDCLPPDTSATDFVSHMARMSGLPSGAARERTAEVLRHVGLYEERYRAMGGYSTGMKQRVKLAQALVHGPRLLLLDEPTNGLDPAGRDEMLALVRRTGTEFGIAVIVASHLLGEIERVCDFLVAIDAGRLLRAAPLGAFTERTGVLAVEVEEGEAQLAAALSARGLQAVADGRTVLLAVTEDAQYDIVRDAVADLSLRLVRLEQRRQSLEDLFRDDVAATPVAASAPAAEHPPASGGPAAGPTRPRSPPAAPRPRRGDRVGASTTSATRRTSAHASAGGARWSRSSHRPSGRPSGSVAAGGPRSRPSRSGCCTSCRPCWPSASWPCRPRRVAAPWRMRRRSAIPTTTACCRSSSCCSARPRPRSCSVATSATACCRCTSRGC